MAKITEYPEALSFDSGDVILKDGANGTKKMTAETLKSLIAPVDSTLSQSGKSADAKTVGDNFEVIEESIEGINEVAFEKMTIDLSQYATTASYISPTTDKWQAESGDQCWLAPVSENTKFLTVTANSTEPTMIAFLASNSHTTGNTPEYVTGGNLVTISPAGSKRFKIPTGCNYIYVAKLSNSEDFTPASFVFEMTAVLALDTTLTESGKAADAKATGEAVDELKTALDGFYEGQAFDYTGVTKSKWIISSNKWILVTGNARSYTTQIPSGVAKIHVTAGANGANITFLKTYAPVADQTPDYSTGYERITLNAGASETYTVNSDMVYFYAALTTSDQHDLTPSVVMDYNRIDDLEEDYQNLNNLEMTSAKTLDAFYFDWYLGRMINTEGEVTAVARYALSYGIPVTAGQIITNKSAAQDSSSRELVFTVAAFSGTTFVADSRVVVAQNGQYVVPSGADNVRISFGYPSSVVNPPDMTTEILGSYFAMSINGFVQPFGLFTDGEHPVYAAFGPSTMEGLKYEKGSRIFSRYDPPNYIGRCLNLKTYNFSVSGTGFVARTSGNADNYMDLIYANADTLSKAKLVTIVSGYGNDIDINLPVGEYTDYYPYDEEGYHPTGTGAEATMIANGATFMGCLNWCIKWINEHYPYAQLVVIFGAPSFNRERTVAMTAQTPSTGVAPYTLTFTDPYDNPTQGTLAYAIKETGVEIDKLKSALNVPIINMLDDGCPISYYSAYAKDPTDSDLYALFGIRNNAWDPHPIDAGYIYYNRYLTGQIAALMTH